VDQQVRPDVLQQGTTGMVRNLQKNMHTAHTNTCQPLTQTPDIQQQRLLVQMAIGVPKCDSTQSITCWTPPLQ
jgi:hypothetical protein